MNERDRTLDIAKGISIILMVISHLEFAISIYGLGFINRNFLLIFKMPLFIIISGYLYSNKDTFSGYIYNKIDGLIKPVVVIFIITSCIGIFTQTVNPENILIYITKFYAPLWFIFSLFFALLGNKILDEAYKRYQTYGMLIASIIIVILFSTLNVLAVSLSIIKFHSLIYFLLFLVLGRMIKRYDLLKYIYQLKYFIIFIGFYIALCVLKDQLKIVVDFNRNFYGNFFTTSTAIILGVFSVLFISKTLSKYKLVSDILVKCSKASLFILVFHVIIGNYILYPLFIKFIGHNFLINVIGFICTIFLCYSIYFLINKTKFVRYLLLPIKSFNK